MLPYGNIIGLNGERQQKNSRSGTIVVLGNGIAAMIPLGNGDGCRDIAHLAFLFDIVTVESSAQDDVQCVAISLKLSISTCVEKLNS
jgi:hypothetical protein